MDGSRITCASTGFRQAPPAPGPELSITVHATLFFDGTLNNAFNTFEREKAERKELSASYKKHGGGTTSYENDYTNVALLNGFLLWPADTADTIYLNIYTEGIGTVNFGADSLEGYATGLGATGIEAKAQKGMSSLIEQLEAKLIRSGQRPQRISTLQIELFGFSRGAATARHFMYAAENSLRLGHWAGHITSATLSERCNSLHLRLDQIEWGFVGLFDTVASAGAVSTYFEHSDTRELHLDAISKARSVFHLTAADEHRVNFALTNIRSAGARGREVALPGVHSDIGGGYRPAEREYFQVVDSDRIGNPGRIFEGIALDLRSLIHQGWFAITDLRHATEDRYLRPGESVLSAVNKWGEVRVRRAGAQQLGLSNLYSRIPLHIMRAKAETNGILMKERIHEHPRTRISASQVPPEIIHAYQCLKKHATAPISVEQWGLSSDILRLLRYNHFHFSACYGSSGGAYHPRFEKGVRKRKIHNG